MRLSAPHSHPAEFRCNRTFTLAVALFFALFNGLSGCATFPELEAAESAQSRAAGYPRIAPLDALLAQGDGGTITPELTATERSRAAALRARATALRRAEG